MNEMLEGVRPAMLDASAFWARIDSSSDDELFAQELIARSYKCVELSLRIVGSIPTYGLSRFVKEFREAVKATGFGRDDDGTGGASA